MLSKRNLATLTAWCTLSAALGTMNVKAAPLELIYSGFFNSQDALNLATRSTPAYFSTPTAFTINSFFDTSSPNYAPAFPPAPPPFGGFRAYAPSVTTIAIGGITYTVDSITTNPTAGIAVAIFDQNSFTPGRYGIGILQQPPQDGAGIIGDFASASPNFTDANITPTIFTSYYGVGYGSGVCLQGTGADCALNAVTPLVLHSGNQTFNLTLGNYDEDYPVIHDSTSQSILGPLNTAQLVAVPEPGTYAVAGISLVGLLGFARRRRRVGRSPASDTPSDLA